MILIYKVRIALLFSQQLSRKPFINVSGSGLTLEVLNSNSLVGKGNGLVGKRLAMAACWPEFDHQHRCQKPGLYQQAQPWQGTGAAEYLVLA